MVSGHLLTALRRVPRGRWSVVALVTILIATGLTLLSDEFPFGSDCVSNDPLFAYTVPAPELRQTDVAVLRDGKQMRLTKDHLSQDPSFSPDGSRVVFSSGRDGDFDPELGYARRALFTASSSGGDEIRLTRGLFDTEPDWSPDGSKVVFVRTRFSGRRGYESTRELIGSELRTIDVRTREERLLLRAPRVKGRRLPRFYSPVWSPDGTRIAFSRADPQEHSLWVMDADGSGARPLVRDAGGSYYDSSALAWSPDGRTLAFHGNTAGGAGVAVITVDDRRPRLLAPEGEWPAWSPNGARVAFFDNAPTGRQLSTVASNGVSRTVVEGAPPLGYVYGRLDWACTRSGAVASPLPPIDETNAACDGRLYLQYRSLTKGNLARADLTPSGDGWAVGDGYVGGPFVVHFDPDGYRVERAVPPRRGSVYLNDVSARGIGDVFVAGGQTTRGGWKPVMLHWDGRDWSRMDMPEPRGGILRGIVAMESGVTWAVGHDLDGSRSRTLVMRFDGVSWSRVKAPSPGRRYAGLTAVDASSARDVWAVGFGGRGGERGVVLRYDGSRWQVVRLPRALSRRPATFSDVDVGGGGHVWIAGSGGRPRHGAIPPLVLHVEGDNWTREPLPDTAGSLSDIEIVGPRDVWVVGERDGRPLALRRRASWQMVGIEDQGVGGELTSLTRGNNAVWAVGEKSGSEWVILRACLPSKNGA